MNPTISETNDLRVASSEDGAQPDAEQWELRLLERLRGVSEYDRANIIAVVDRMVDYVSRLPQE